MATHLQRLIDSIESLATPDQMTPTRTPGLTVYTWGARTTQMHLVYQPSLCVLLRGEKLARIDTRSFAYNRERFFFTAVPLPAELLVERTSKRVLVGLVLELDLELVARVALEMDDAGGPSEERGRTSPTPPPMSSSMVSPMFTGEVTPGLVEALDRLVRASKDGLRHRVLHHGLLREVFFELLAGPQGPDLRTAVHEQGKLRGLIDVMRYMDEHSCEPLAIPDLASRAGMSESGFYAKFREATGSTPLQYLKLLRLSKARVQLVAGADSVTQVALEVGYASSAQFSRDFRKAFGCPPSALFVARGNGPPRT